MKRQEKPVVVAPSTPPTPEEVSTLVDLYNDNADQE